MAEKVVILGGGIGGMSAAHELIERGYEVEIHERQLVAGGKARSIPVLEDEGDHGSKKRHDKALRDWLSMKGPMARPGSKRPWLPGEHGFRFFPNFYRHITDTMGRIPFYDKGTCLDNLVDTTQVLVALYDEAGIIVPERFPRNLKEVSNALKTVLYAISPRDQISFAEVEHFAACMWKVITSCKERRFDEYERIGWWDFIGAEGRSEAYQKFLAIGLTRSLVASKARTASAKTVGDVAVQLQLGLITPEVASNRLLNGPTNFTWIQPWLEYLVKRGVKYHFDSTVREIECRDGRITGALVEQGGVTKKITGDWFISALPVERMAPLVTPVMADIDASLGRLTSLAHNVQWMNGIQFYLTQDVKLSRGHTIFIDSTWALTAVSQKQFWTAIDFSNWGDGKTQGLISVDISEWHQPGLNGKNAIDCTRKEIAEEVWAQMKRSLNVDGQDILRDEDLHFWFLDPDIANDPKDPARKTNEEPLLVNRINTWRLRPEAATAIPNLFLAADYVRTNTDLATMEGANEAARTAVNALLDRCGSNAERCRIWDLHEPDALKPLRAYDRARYHAGLPWDERFAVAVEASMKMAQTATGMNIGGEGPLQIIAPFTAEWSKPGGILEDPVISEALRMIGPPSDMIPEMAGFLPGLTAPIPGADAAAEMAQMAALVSQDAGAARADNHPDTDITQVGRPASSSGRRLSITQKD